MTEAEREAVLELLEEYEGVTRGEFHGTRSFNNRMRAADAARGVLGLPLHVDCLCRFCTPVSPSASAPR